MRASFRSFVVVVLFGHRSLLVRGTLTETGTTVGPGHDRAEGQKSEKCPASHPYAFDSGRHCCSAYVRESGCTGAASNGDKLLFEDPEGCCSAADTDDCPADVIADMRVCTSPDIDESSYGTCPTAHPVAFHHGSKCCSKPLRSGSCSTSNSGAIDSDDASDCCADTVVDCDAGVYPCKSQSSCFLKSPSPITYATAQPWCEDNYYLKAGFKSEVELQEVVDAVPSLADGTEWAWVQLTARIAIADIGACQREACDGQFIFDDGVTYYSHSESGIDLRIDDGQVTDQVYVRYFPDTGELILTDGAVDHMHGVVCRCVP